MNYVDVQPIALAILTSIITGGFVLVFVEIGNRKQRENERFDQKMTPFMHKLSAYFRFVSWCSHRIIYPKPVEGYNKDFKELVNFLGRYGGRAITSGGDYQIGHFNAEKLEDIALKINNVWYYHDKMNPCTLTWNVRGGNDDFIDKELREINSLYHGISHDVNMVAKVSGDFYVDIYQPIEYDTYRHEAYLKQYKRNTIVVAGAFLFVLAVLCTMLYCKLPVLLLQILTTIVILLLILSLGLLAVDTMTQIKWWNNMVKFKNKMNMKDWINKIKKDFRSKVRFCITKVKDYIISGLVVIGLLFSAWAIFSIEIPLIPRLPTCFSARTIEGIDRLFLALAYSYVAGAILYWFTSTLPFLRNKNKLKDVIDQKITGIGSQLSAMHLEFIDINNPTNPSIDEIDAIMALFSLGRWTEACRVPLHSQPNVTWAFVDDYHSLQNMIGCLINDYKAYLSTKELILLESIRESSLNTIFEAGKNFRYQYSEYVYNLSIQPAYRKMLENYNELKNMR